MCNWRDLTRLNDKSCEVMKSERLPEDRTFIQSYFKHYSARNPIIKNFFNENFCGLDGISNTIYDKDHWLHAIDYDFKQISEPFNIRITDYNSQGLSNDLTLITTVSFWDIQLFKDFLFWPSLASFAGQSWLLICLCLDF